MTQDSDASILAAAGEVLREGAACLTTAADRLSPDFIAATRALAAADSFTMVVGVGKSGHIGRKLVASLLSTGHGAAFVHPTDALHGDIGIAEHSTFAVLLSHSGNTEELVKLIPVLKQFGIKSALIAKGRDCALTEHVDWVIETHVVEEAGMWRLAPTSSSTTTLALCDALMMASLSLRGFSPDLFRRYHPGGMLGQQLRRVADVMLPLDRLAWVTPDANMATIIDAISTGGIGFVMVGTGGTTQQTAEVGFISDGDIRRAAGDQSSFGGLTAAAVMTRAPLSIAADALAIEALRMMEQHAVTSLLCSGADGELVGAVHIHGAVARELGLTPARGQAPA